MIKEEFYFDSRDGESRIHAVRYTPDDGNVKGIVQVVHGMAEYVERYENLAEFLTARGILVTGEDHLWRKAALTVTSANRIRQR